jgi:FlaG/FlaF family flagellin (archaellin)
MKTIPAVLDFILCAFAALLLSVGKAMAASPTAVVTLVCEDFGASSVVYYAASPGAPAQISNASCAVELASLEAAGFLNSNATMQIYAAGSPGVLAIGAPGQVNGTYSTYILVNGILASGNL